MLIVAKQQTIIYHSLYELKSKDDFLYSSLSVISGLNILRLLKICYIFVRKPSTSVFFRFLMRLRLCLSLWRVEMSLLWSDWGKVLRISWIAVASCLVIRS